MKKKKLNNSLIIQIEKGLLDVKKIISKKAKGHTVKEIIK